MNRHQELAITALEAARTHGCTQLAKMEQDPDQAKFFRGWIEQYRKTIPEIDEAIEWIKNLKT